MTKVKSGWPGTDEGSALFVALIGSTLLTALGLALAGVSVVEIGIAANHRAGAQAAYAVEAGVDVVISDLLTVPNWTDILGGIVSSRLTGSAVPPVGPGESPVALAQLTAAVQAESDAAASWGANSPQWRLFAYGWLYEAAPGSLDSDEYLIAWVADDVGEVDNDPFVDTNRRVQVLARARSARGIERSVVAVVEQTTTLTTAGLPGARVLAWREVR